MVPVPDPKHNAEIRRRKRQLEDADECAARMNLELLQKARLEDWPHAHLVDYYAATKSLHDREEASVAAPRLYWEMLVILRIYLRPEEIEEPEEEPAYDAPESEDESAPQDREATWQQEYHHRPPPRPPAAPSPFIAHVVCLHCETFFLGQLIVRTTSCPLCGSAQLRAVGEWDTRYSAWWPFHQDGGAA